jgi:8-oxo-dGTP pyrophosphatase MutT (NUDIX family)
MSYGYIPFSANNVPEGYVVPRDAATIMVVRDVDQCEMQSSSDDAASFEVLMLKKATNAQFAGGAHVFPGGALDDGDRELSQSKYCVFRDEKSANELLGVESSALTFWVAGIRECFEESGLLFAYEAGDGSLISFEDPVKRAKFSNYRQALNKGKMSFSDLCEQENLILALDQLFYFSHWITPEGVPRRYDTRFFVAKAPPGQVALNDGSETISSVWISPDNALKRGEAGEIQLIFATIKNLEAIGRLSCADELIAAAQVIDTVPTTLPKVTIDGREIRILLPGDEGYEHVSTFAPDQTITP